MMYLIYVLIPISITVFTYGVAKITESKKIINSIDEMLDLAIRGEFSNISFDESVLSKVESKFMRYLLGISASEINLVAEKRRIEALISDISHQTKTPISNISLYSQLLIEKPSKEYVVEINSQTKKLNFLIDSLLKASRLEHEIIKLNPSINSCNVIIKNVLKAIENKAKEKNISTSFYGDNECTAYFDPKWTEEAIYNIVDNSIKYSHCDSEIIIKITEYQMFLRIDVIDKGIGISQEDIPKIFQRFYRAEAVSTTEGVGIGLNLSREIIQREKGYIKVQSHIGKGSTFSIFLPRYKE